MKALITLIAIVSLILVLSSILGVESVSWSNENGFEASKFDVNIKRLQPLIVSVLLLVWAFLIAKKSIVGWWVGTAFHLSAIMECIRYGLNNAFNISTNYTDVLVNLLGNIILAILILIIFKSWWLKKKATYFMTSRAKNAA